MKKIENKKKRKPVAKEPARKGRPPFDRYDINYMCKKIDEYIASKQKSLPILKECCLLNNWNYRYTMELRAKYPLLTEHMEKLLDWKEVRLEQGGLTGQFHASMASLSLKQLGWRDKQEEEQPTDRPAININITRSD